MPSTPSLIWGFQTSIPGPIVLPKPAPKRGSHIHHVQGPLSDFPISFTHHETKALILTSQALLNRWISSRGLEIWDSLSWESVGSSLAKELPSNSSSSGLEGNPRADLGKDTKWENEGTHTLQYWPQHTAAH